MALDFDLALKLKRIALVLFLASTCANRTALCAANSEVQVKATIVFNFLRMVYWTNVDGEQNPDELPICALNASELFSAIQSVTRNREVGGRKVVTAVVPNPSISRCRVLIIEPLDYERASSVIRRLRYTPVLTIGNGKGFVDIGGLFELLVEEGNVRFDVNLAAIRESGLEVSARLLRLAKRFRGGGGVGGS